MQFAYLCWNWTLRIDRAFFHNSAKPLKALSSISFSSCRKQVRLSWLASEISYMLRQRTFKQSGSRHRLVSTVYSCDPAKCTDKSNGFVRRMDRILRNSARCELFHFAFPRHPRAGAPKPRKILPPNPAKTGRNYSGRSRQNRNPTHCIWSM
jgi:hypothetical protein